MKRFLLAAGGCLLAGAAMAQPVPPNVLSYIPADPTGPASTTMTMMGIGYSGEFTPRVSGAVRITISGTFANNTASDGAKAQIQYGTGTAPANAGTFAGTACGNNLIAANGSLTGNVSNKIPFTLSCIATGMVLNTPYWIDLAAAQVTGGTVTLTNVTVTASEM